MFITALKRRVKQDLAAVQHAAESSLLSGRNLELVVALDLDPALGVGAVEAAQGRLPRIRAAVALGLVDVVGDGPELRTGDVVGKGLALGCLPA